MAGLRSTGLAAPLALDGPANGSALAAYVEQVLAATPGPGGVVVLDPRKPLRDFAGLGAHKVAGVEKAIRAMGASLLCLPPHSPDLDPPDLDPPDLDPIEQTFQAQGPAPPRRGLHQGNALDHHRAAPRPVQPDQVPKSPH